MRTRTLVAVAVGLVVLMPGHAASRSPSGGSSSTIPRTLSSLPETARALLGAVAQHDRTAPAVLLN